MMATQGRNIWYLETEIEQEGSATLKPFVGEVVEKKKKVTDVFSAASKIKSAIQDPVGAVSALLFGAKAPKQTNLNPRKAPTRGELNLSIINVVDDFVWTNSPKRPHLGQPNDRKSRSNTPFIILRESKLSTNTQMNQLIYSILTASNKVNEGADVIKKIAANTSAKNQRDTNAAPKDSAAPADKGTPQTAEKKDAKGKVGEVVDAAKEKFGGFLSSMTTGGGIGNKIKNAVESVTEEARNKIDESMRKLNYEPVSSGGVYELQPYDALYLTEPTGFIYYFPYFNDKSNVLSNTFNDSSNNDNNPIGDIAANFAKGVASNLTKFNVMAPGTYIESPKYYGFDAGGEEYEVTFPLLNTRTWDDVRANWQLIFMLLYQNLPNRITRDRIDPPAIYEVSVPGSYYTPYAYIKSLSIDFKGTRQLMMMDVPQIKRSKYIKGDKILDNTQIETIIPEAYVVTITLKSLVPQTKNLLYATMMQDSIVTTYKRTIKNGLGTVADDLKKVVSMKSE